MKTIRRSVFETNSSSMHSFSISKDTERATLKELYGGGKITAEALSDYLIERNINKGNLLATSELDKLIILIDMYFTTAYLDDHSIYTGFEDYPIDKEKAKEILDIINEVLKAKSDCILDENVYGDICEMSLGESAKKILCDFGDSQTDDYDKYNIFDPACRKFFTDILEKILYNENIVLTHTEVW